MPTIPGDNLNESVSEVVLEYNCPVCSTRSRAVYEKRTCKMSLSGLKKTFYSLKYLIPGSKKFERYCIDNITLLSCPSCGVMLNAEVREKEIPWIESEL